MGKKTRHENILRESAERCEIKRMTSSGVIDRIEPYGIDEETGLLPKDKDDKDDLFEMVQDFLRERDFGASHDLLPVSIDKNPDGSLAQADMMPVIPTSLNKNGIDPLPEDGTREPAANVISGKKSSFHKKTKPTLIEQRQSPPICQVDQETRADLNPSSHSHLNDEMRNGNPDTPMAGTSLMHLKSTKDAEEDTARKNVRQISSPERWEIRQMISSGVIDRTELPDFDEETGLLPKDEEDEAGDDISAQLSKNNINVYSNPGDCSNFLKRISNIDFDDWDSLSNSSNSDANAENK
ncbi:ATP-dependent RNA helicase DHX8-like isoform X2 [Sitodiplosis mosellana]|uniref:ATP-dependent RNA helicase DHX8-like isoform X2 n=1 Tax=Sitodiplosis mosellana TaxID=263140 RepID=UPI00244485AE|nr:ATP-dependent RNA helicase DHX8-like isoform X2 [Sitodiplosis mosellana]